MQLAAIVRRRLLAILAVPVDQSGALFGEWKLSRIAVRSSVIDRSWQLAFQDALLQQTFDRGHFTWAA